MKDSLDVDAFSVLALASIALAFTTEPDFAPFVIRKEVWNANMSTSGAGTEVSEIVYTSATDWRVTIISNSASPRYAGTTWTFRGNNTFFSDALHRITRSYDGSNGVDRWIAPGLARTLAQNASWRTMAAPAGTLHVRQVETSVHDGVALTHTTDAIFEAATGLPTSIEIRGNAGELLQRWTYTRE